MEKRFEAIGKKIRKRRKEMGFATQEALAKAVGTDRTRVSRWESGEEFPDTYKAKLLQVLNASEDLLRGDISPAKQALVDLICSDSVSDARARILFEMLSLDAPAVLSNEKQAGGTTRRG